jgi:hypothetical protein
MEQLAGLPGQLAFVITTTICRIRQLVQRNHCRKNDQYIQSLNMCGKALL